MLYSFNSFGHRNITATHKTTLEFTKHKELSLKGDCIVGVNSNFDLNKIKEFINNIKNKKIKIIIKINNKETKINAEINPDFNDDDELVIRKTGFVSERTFAIHSDKSASDIRNYINLLRNTNTKIEVVIE